MGGWAEEHHAARMRGSSDASVDSVPVGGITLQDNETPGAAGDPYHGGGYGWGVQGYGQQGQGQQPIGQGGTGSAVATGAGGSGSGSWARSVQLKDYVIVNGSATNIGAFVVWNVRVQTLTVSFTLCRVRAKRGRRAWGRRPQKMENIDVDTGTNRSELTVARNRETT